jgi:maleylpyruvate isomerase
VSSARLDRIRELHHEWERVVRALPATAFREPSALPGWTRGHLCTHLARNADGLGNLLSWAETGVEKPMYGPGTARDDDIEAGSRRSAEQIVADVVDSGQRLTDRIAGASAATWSAPIRHRLGQALTGADILALRLVETTIHLADLDAGHDFSSATGLLGDQFDTVVTALMTVSPYEAPSFRLTDGTHTWIFGEGGELVTGKPETVLAWLTGRDDGSALSGPVPKFGSLI